MDKALNTRLDRQRAALVAETQSVSLKLIGNNWHQAYCLAGKRTWVPTAGLVTP
jgi:hypothetical protein